MDVDVNWQQSDNSLSDASSGPLLITIVDNRRLSTCVECACSHCHYIVQTVVHCALTVLMEVVLVPHLGMPVRAGAMCSAMGLCSFDNRL